MSGIPPRGEAWKRGDATDMDGGETAGAEGAPRTAWHAMAAEAALAALSADAGGLSAAEAARRLAEAGPNRLAAAKRESVGARILRQFRNLLIYVLLAAAALSAIFGHPVDAAVILSVVLVNAAIGFAQEGRAERALEAIRSMIDPQATVLRDGRRRAVPAETVAPGDVVLLEAGDRAPADLRLLRARGLTLDESILTGESVPVEKSAAPAPEGAVLGDRTSMAYSGCFVAAGQGAGLVVETGPRTELGRISALVGGVETLKTPLIRKMDAFAHTLTIWILGAAAAAFLVATLLRGYAFDEGFMAVVGLAVAAIPEGLPAIMTITLAIGVQRMAARNAIIRRLPAVETLGSVSVICSDKTGTLTRNEMSARRVVTPSARHVVEGGGYGPEGRVFDEAGETAAADPGLRALARAACLCNDADLASGPDGWRVEGDPMEGALLAFALKAGLDPAAERAAAPRRDEIPFDSAWKYMATLHDAPEGPLLLAKGAPERLLAMCAEEDGPDGPSPLDREAWRERAHALAADGMRVLAFARAAAPERGGVTPEDLDGRATLIGLVGFLDPPRDEARAAVAECRRAGVRVVMITGDHAATALAIARRLDLDAEPVALAGADLADLDGDALRAAARETAVFARTAPEDKLRLVEALQAEGLVVAMTGDGVNDAPALKRADVGVAMGRRGSEAAKEAAEMVLADDDFASIAAAVREGRTVYDNLMKVIAWTLPTNGGEAATVLAAIVFGVAMPITPVQILWVNMITAVALGLTLAFDPTDPRAMTRPPRAPGAPILDRPLMRRIAFVSALFVAGAFGAYFWALSRGLGVEAARTLVVNGLVAMEVAYLLSVRHVPGRPGALVTRAVALGVAAVALAQAAFTYWGPMQAIFETRPLGLLDGATLLVLGAALFGLVEAEKAWARRRGEAR